MARTRKNYQNRLKYFKANEKSIIKIQSLVKMWIARKQYKKKLQHFHDNVRLFL